MTNFVFAALCSLMLFLALPARAADNLKLNQHLDYTSDRHDGMLIDGDRLEDGLVPGKPTYAVFYGEACFNSKRQARRTVELYDKYKGKVQFVVVDLDRAQSAAQRELVKKYYKGYIPHVIVLDRDGKAAYNSSGEVDSGEISKYLEKALAQ